jgi:hypothetical protein
MVNELYVLEAKISQLENEIANNEAARISQEMRLIDAEEPTGNEDADRQIAHEAGRALNTIVMLDRMLATRRAKVAELKGRRNELAQEGQRRNRAFEQPYEADPPEVPPTTGPMIQQVL